MPNVPSAPARTAPRSLTAADNPADALVFVRGDRTAQVDLGDGATEEVDLIPTTLSDWSAGLVDLTGNNVTELEAIRVLDPDGS